MTNSEIINYIFQIRDEVNKQKGSFGKLLNCKAVVYFSSVADFPLCFPHEFTEILGVSSSEWRVNSELKEGFTVELSKCEGNACPRCWQVHNFNNFENLCNRCVEVILKDYPDHYSFAGIKEFHSRIYPAAQEK